MSPEQLLGELESEGRLVLCDMEAGLGTVVRIQPGQLDVLLVVAEPSAKGIDVATRAAAIGASRARVIVVANRIREPADLEAIRSALGEHELIVVPEDAAIARADRDGLAPIDVDPDAPGVRALIDLAERLGAELLA
ncbi:MAG: ATP-binding protein [Solirubrobacteraceae bacterium]